MAGEIAYKGQQIHNLYEKAQNSIETYFKPELEKARRTLAKSNNLSKLEPESRQQKVDLRKLKQMIYKYDVTVTENKNKSKNQSSPALQKMRNDLLDSYIKRKTTRCTSDTNR